MTSAHWAICLFALSFLLLYLGGVPLYAILQGFGVVAFFGAIIVLVVG